MDEFYTLQETQLVPLTIPLGSAAAAQATQNVYLNGNLTPTGDVATTAEVIDSDVLGDASIARPDINERDRSDRVSGPSRTRSGIDGRRSVGPGAGFVAGDQYEYVFTYLDRAGQRNTAPRNDPGHGGHGRQPTSDRDYRLAGLPSSTRLSRT